jgi:hypothetical protein
MKTMATVLDEALPGASSMSSADGCDFVHRIARIAEGSA